MYLQHQDWENLLDNPASKLKIIDEAETNEKVEPNHVKIPATDPPKPKDEINAKEKVVEPEF